MKRPANGVFWSRIGWLVLAGLCASLLSAGCSTAKYEQQIEEQKGAIAQLENEKYQLQTLLSAEKAGNTELLRRFMSGTKTEAVPTTGGKTASRPSGTAMQVGKTFKGLDVVEVDGYSAIVLSSGMLFDSGKATLSKSGLAKLAEVTQALKSSFPESSIRVDGHTDNTPIKKSKFSSNWALSVARAEAVMNYLINTAKFDKGKLSLTGFGDTRPRQGNSTESGRKANRRVELVIMD